MFRAIYSFFSSTTPPADLTMEDVSEDTESPSETTVVTPQQAFHTHASFGEGIIISACTSRASGCHDFANALAHQFPAMDTGKVVFDGWHLSRTVFQPATDKATHWRCAVITGCDIQHSQFHLRLFADDARFKAIKYVYLVAPPHHQTYIQPAHFAVLHQVYSELALQASLLTAGIDGSLSHAMGMPDPLSHLPKSAYLLGADCYGVMYNPLPMRRNATDYLQRYFSQIRFLHRSQKPVSVMAIEVPLTDMSFYTDTAGLFNMQVNFVNKLPQADFIAALRQLGERDGILSVNGVQALIQACYLGTSVQVYYHDECNGHNKQFFQQLLTAMPEKQHDMAAAILGQSEEKPVNLQDRKRYHHAQKSLQSLFWRAVTQFEQSRRITVPYVPEKAELFEEMKAGASQEENVVVSERDQWVSFSYAWFAEARLKKARQWEKALDLRLPTLK